MSTIMMMSDYEFVQINSTPFPVAFRSTNWHTPVISVLRRNCYEIRVQPKSNTVTREERSGRCSPY